MRAINATQLHTQGNGFHACGAGKLITMLFCSAFAML
jgi:hypothetical protein